MCKRTVVNPSSPVCDVEQNCGKPPAPSAQKDRESDDPRIEPTIYRTVIDDVIANIKPEFDEYGVTQEVLDQLQDVRAYFPPFIGALLMLRRNGSRR